MSWIRVTVWGLVLTCYIVSPTAGIDFPCGISGECIYDPTTDKTVCTYVVVSGTPALSHLIIPFSENCIQNYEVTSSFFRFEAPQAYDEPFCGEIYGIKSDREMGDGQVDEFSITYVGNLLHRVDLVEAALKYATDCERYLVPAIMDCDFIPDCQFSLDFSVYDFYIRKPGTYAGPVATFTATSNLPINITFESFGNLDPVQSFGFGQIPACYQIAPPEQTEPPAQFLTPVEFDQQTIVIPDDEAEHSFSIWLKIMVGTEITGCDYADDAIIRVEIENLEEYIDLDP